MHKLKYLGRYLWHVVNQLFHIVFVIYTYSAEDSMEIDGEDKMIYTFPALKKRIAEEQVSLYLRFADTARLQAW